MTDVDTPFLYHDLSTGADSLQKIDRHQLCGLGIAQQ